MAGVGGVPVTAEHHRPPSGAELGGKAVEHAHHRVAAVHGQRTPRTEIVLDVNDQQRGVAAHRGVLWSWLGLHGANLRG